MLSSPHICSIYYSSELHNKNFELNYQQANFLKFHYNAVIQCIDDEPGSAVKHPLEKL